MDIHILVNAGKENVTGLEALFLFFFQIVGYQCDYAGSVTAARSCLAASTISVSAFLVSGH